MEEASREIRSTASAEQARVWSLVLASQAVRHDLRQTLAGWTIYVDAAEAARASEILAVHDREAATQKELVPDREYGPTSAAYLVSLLLLFAYALTSRSRLAYEAGSAAAESIRNGEPWRVVTALTLHANIAHAAANAVACAIFGTALMRLVGPGVGVVLLLATGIGGNLINAYVRPLTHVAVGASTSVFGAVGALAGMQLTRRRSSSSRWRAWVPLAAGVALLAWLGMSPDSDVLAHAFGFLVGAALGTLLPHVVAQPPPHRVQVLLVLCTAAIVAVSWALALAGSARA